MLKIRSIISDFFRYFAEVSHYLAIRKSFRSEIFAVLGAHDIQTQEQGDPEYYDIEEIIIVGSKTLLKSIYMCRF